MATPTKADKQDGTQDVTEDLGRLVLASGAVVTVPAENIASATHHYDDTLSATVPVVSSFVLDRQ